MLIADNTWCNLLELFLVALILCSCDICKMSNTAGQLMIMGKMELENQLNDPESWKCPAPLLNRNSSHHCQVRECRSHAECKRKKQRSLNTGRLCCFNGCVRTCMTATEGAPIIDWVAVPHYKLEQTSTSNEELSAQMKRHAGHHPQYGAEIVETSVLLCSTAPQGGVNYPDLHQLRCPLGMTCQITDIGSPLLHQLPTRGQCVYPARTKRTPSMVGTAAKARGAVTVLLKGGCLLTDHQYETLNAVRTQPHIKQCGCYSGRVECLLR